MSGWQRKPADPPTSVWLLPQKKPEAVSGNRELLGISLGVTAVAGAAVLGSWLVGARWAAYAAGLLAGPGVWAALMAVMGIIVVLTAPPGKKGLTRRGPLGPDNPVHRGDQVRVSRDMVTIWRDGIPQELPRAADVPAELEGDTLRVGELVADVRGIHLQTLEQALSDMGWFDQPQPPAVKEPRTVPRSRRREGTWEQPAPPAVRPVLIERYEGYADRSVAEDADWFRPSRTWRWWPIPWMGWFVLGWFAFMTLIFATTMLEPTWVEALVFGGITGFLGVPFGMVAMSDGWPTSLAAVDRSSYSLCVEDRRVVLIRPRRRAKSKNRTFWQGEDLVWDPNREVLSSPTAEMELTGIDGPALTAALERHGWRVEKLRAELES